MKKEKKGSILHGSAITLDSGGEKGTWLGIKKNLDDQFEEHTSLSTRVTKSEALLKPTKMNRVFRVKWGAHYFETSPCFYTNICVVIISTWKVHGTVTTTFWYLFWQGNHPAFGTPPVPNNGPENWLGARLHPPRTGKKPLPERVFCEVIPTTYERDCNLWLSRMNPKQPPKPPINHWFIFGIRKKTPGS